MAPASLKRKLMVDSSSGRRRNSKTKKTRKTNKHLKTTKTTTTASIAAQRDTKPPPVASLSNTEDLKPKVEYSPTGIAKCTACRKKIKKEHKRFGIPEHSERYNKQIYRYYHVQCCPPALQAMVPNASDELKRQKAAAQNKQHIVEQRQELLHNLKQMRLHFANRLEVPFFMVLSNATLEELVVQMPTNNTQLLNVRGIGPKKLQSFGDPILALIQQYTEKVLLREASVKSERKPVKAGSMKQRARIKANSASTAIAIDDSDTSDNESDDSFYMGKTLTCEELVSQKFEHAAANGYMISVDD
jgi:superfamily II DNA helicase RecQ